MLNASDPNLIKDVAKLGLAGWASDNRIKGKAPKSLPGFAMQQVGSYFMWQYIWHWLLFPLIGITAAICFLPDIVLLMVSPTHWHYHIGGPTKPLLGVHSSGWWVLFWILFAASAILWLAIPGQLIFRFVWQPLTRAGNQSNSRRKMITQDQALIIYFHSQMFTYAMANLTPPEYIDDLLHWPTRKEWEDCFPSSEWQKHARQANMIVPKQFEWSKRYPATKQEWFHNPVFEWLYHTATQYGQPSVNEARIIDQTPVAPTHAMTDTWGRPKVA